VRELKITTSQWGQHAIFEKMHPSWRLLWRRLLTPVFPIQVGGGCTFSFILNDAKCD
jgi:hypothetical protein